MLHCTVCSRGFKSCICTASTSKIEHGEAPIKEGPVERFRHTYTDPEGRLPSQSVLDAASMSSIPFGKLEELGWGADKLLPALRYAAQLASERKEMRLRLENVLKEIGDPECQTGKAR